MVSTATTRSRIVGAGGKLVLTYRIAYLIGERQVLPSKYCNYLYK